MYAGFNLNVNQSQGLTLHIDFSQYRTQGKTHLATQENAVRRNLSEFVLEGTSIPDGTAIQDDWFPEVDADIFISHSHKDIGLAEGLAGWLNETFGLRCFIDYNVWGYADNLLEEINSQYSNKRTDQFGGVIYDHQSCIAASKHVDTMLTMALYKMIDRCECVFLLNTGIKFSWVSLCWPFQLCSGIWTVFSWQQKQTTERCIVGFSRSAQRAIGCCCTN